MQRIRHLIPQPVKRTDSQQPLVMVIDNQPSIRDMLSWALFLQGYQPACTANSQEAFTWLKQALPQGIYPRVILLDAQTPDVQGKLFLENLRNLWTTSAPFPSIILLTMMKDQYHSLPCESVLIKPFHIGDLYKNLGFLLNTNR